MVRNHSALFAAWLIACHVSTGALGSDFRVDTEFFEGDEKQPSMVSLTIFANGIVYDFRHTEPREVTVFDPLHGHFTLLDEGRRVKAKVTTQELLDYALDLEKHAVKEKGLLGFCARPDFSVTESLVQQNGQELTEVRLEAKPLSYVARGQKPPHPDAAKAYRQFTDWCARLNATWPGNLPPAARLALNQALADRELLPLEITRTIPVRSTSSVVRSQHRVNWTLSGDDQKRIDRAGNDMATFELVSYDKYREQPNKPSDKQARR